MRKADGCKWLLIVVMCTITITTPAPAQTFQTLLTFNGLTNGGVPQGSLLQGVDGKLYGTALYGVGGYGMVFDLTTAGFLTIIYNFGDESSNGPGGLVQSPNGYFYGTTFEGGANDGGSVFKISPTGELHTLYNFCAQTDCTDGDGPSALVQAGNGDFYGVTYSGGTYTGGTVFKITSTGTLTTLYNFCSQSNCSDGAYPEAALIQAANGDLYGSTTSYGPNFYGTIFKMTLDGVLSTVHAFSLSDGASPVGVIQATNGNFYGTTEFGGADDDGTVFRMTPAGAVTTLHSFSGSDGYLPRGSLVQATNGKLYGTTLYGGITNINCYAGSCGTLFEITPLGKFTTVVTFNSTNGSNPFGGLYQATDGVLYGTTQIGGNSNYGTVFSLSFGLAPFAETLPTFGKLGARIIILGTDLTGASSVTFNGRSAMFHLLSSTEIVATVPTGATTGYVTVTTPTGTLTSNVPFRVIP